MSAPARKEQESTLKRIATIITAAALLSAASLAYAADYKIGFVNTERLFREAAPAKRAQQKLEKEFAARDAEIQKLVKQVRDLQTALDRDGPTMAESERRNKERDLANQSRDQQRMQRAQQKLEKEFAARDAEIQKLVKQVRDLQTALDRDGPTMAESERRNKERDLANQSRDLQRMQREAREDLNLRRNEELASLQERANKLIQQIAIDEKFDLILQDPVVYASQRIDITEKVIKALADK